MDYVFKNGNKKLTQYKRIIKIKKKYLSKERKINKNGGGGERTPGSGACT